METMVVGYWNGKKEKIKQRFPGITDQDLIFCDGKEKEMMEMLEYKLEIPKLELAKIIEAL
jgi:5'(3')-deoxyribonucleotidase